MSTQVEGISKPLFLNRNTSRLVTYLGLKLEILVDVNVSAHVEGLKWPFHMLEIACQSVSRPSSQSL